MRMRIHMLRQKGATLLEVLITLIIMAFGLLGIAGIQAEIHRLELESYQRSQAIVLMNSMVDRMNLNRSEAISGAYATSEPLGVGSAEQDCAGTSGAALDLCEWANLLRGAAEKSGTNPVGAMSEARGCITAFTQNNSGACQTGYQIDVIWLASTPSSGSSTTCGADLFDANYAAYRRAVSARVATGASAC